MGWNNNGACPILSSGCQKSGFSGGFVLIMWSCDVGKIFTGDPRTFPNGRLVGWMLKVS